MMLMNYEVMDLFFHPSSDNTIILYRNNAISVLCYSAMLSSSLVPAIQFPTVTVTHNCLSQISGRCMHAHFTVLSAGHNTLVANNRQPLTG